jgi:hypothetical protein
MKINIKTAVQNRDKGLTDFKIPDNGYNEFIS